MRRALLPVLALIAACGPMTVAQAERECYDRARLAQKPRGSVQIGGTSGGNLAGGLDLEISTDYLMGKDPSVVYETCVMAKSGAPPSRPLYDRPDWKG